MIDLFRVKALERENFILLKGSDGVDKEILPMTLAMHMFVMTKQNSKNVNEQLKW